MKKVAFGSVNDLEIIDLDSDFSENIQTETEQTKIALKRSSWEHEPQTSNGIDENPKEPEVDLSHLKSKWNDEDVEIKETTSIHNLHEIELYDQSKSLEENFDNEFQSKYLLVEVKKNGSMQIDSRIPDQFSKVVFDVNKIEEYGLPEFAVVDYDSIFGTRLTSFINYNSDFFSCDERVFFEALLIKFKRLNHYKPFYWSKEVIKQELGIKKDRANRIIKKFEELGIISTEVKKSILNGRPQQVTYFNLHANKICELLPKIYIERESEVSQIDELKKYLIIKKN